ncbi:hypothetical protein BDZ97DRAFT_1766772 [Flammula alnicola]|nr:hypothetical protein BDZ97DRAFT_1766772 [Flammula alnicola]
MTPGRAANMVVVWQMTMVSAGRAVEEQRLLWGCGTLFAEGSGTKFECDWDAGAHSSVGWMQTSRRNAAGARWCSREINMRGVNAGVDAGRVKVLDGDVGMYMALRVRVDVVVDVESMCGFDVGGWG